MCQTLHFTSLHFTSLSTNCVGKSKVRSNLGFTLIELSIVLVIIGLVVGGVLVGKDLIYASAVRSQIKQIEEIETQINTFKLKYNCLPGDCANATDYFGSTDSYGNSIANGNGDGIIKATYSSSMGPYGDGECLQPNISGEVGQLFQHLGLAGLGNYAKGVISPGGRSHIGLNYPYAKIGNGTGIIVTCLGSVDVNLLIATPLFLRQGNIITIGVSGSGIDDGGRISYATAIGAAVWTAGNYGQDGGGNSIAPIGIPVDVARKIDEKIDDGKPSSGKFGITAGNNDTYCNNSFKSGNNQPLLTAYPPSSVSCQVTPGKKID